MSTDKRLGGGGAAEQLHLLRLCFVVVSVVVVVILSVGALSLLGVVLLLFLCRLDLVQGLPLLGELVGLSDIITQDNVVKNGAALHLPQVEAQKSEIGVRVNLVIVHILRVGDLLRLPESLVRRVRDPLNAPISLVRRVVLHGGLPLAILLVIPIIWLRRRLVHDAFLLHPVVRLLVLGIVHPM